MKNKKKHSAIYVQENGCYQQCVPTSFNFPTQMIIFAPNKKVRVFVSCFEALPINVSILRQ